MIYLVTSPAESKGLRFASPRLPITMDRKTSVPRNSRHERPQRPSLSFFCICVGKWGQYRLRGKRSHWLPWISFSDLLSTVWFNNCRTFRLIVGRSREDRAIVDGTRGQLLTTLGLIVSSSGSQSISVVRCER